MKSRLSIITINYNDLVGLKRTVKSVLNQTLHAFEYIVIDGGSVDGSKEFIAKNNDSIDYWVSEEDLGIYNAMNKGISAAEGEYLLFLNSGDHLYNDTIIEKVIQDLKEYDLIYSNLEMVGEKNSKIVHYPAELRFSYMFFNTLPHPATFIKKTLFDTVGLYDENLKVVSDWKFFMLALFKEECSYHKLEIIVASYYLGGISSQINTIEEKNKVRKENFTPFVLDYVELNSLQGKNNSELNKMLSEIDKSIIGRKLGNILVRMLYFIFAKKQ
ncbi:Glycosyltransferase involved in cell wall bisynthesis [Flavobacterium gillisiae]|uniref:Glycosyltransferase involved in cell wall bisynthesis n=1 Tax=Flavobacterium gillisiae TaxID=150146 RepID=A0A1H4EVG2_9FLAO|nr:glycosyltransferase family 2 protein [Flavobacterium gillisiae]SEA89025.1 Glycosyltransferase involved in cell wall bisynthesis [Flavobacterium gillisiae]